MAEKFKKFIPFGEPKISPQEIKEMVKTLKTGWLGAGPKVSAFEEAFKRYVHARQALAVSSCTAALHLSLIAAGIKPGDEVITTPLTYAATANVIFQVGAKPVFADVARETYNLDPQEIRKKITPKTKAIIPVHFGGLPADLTEINKIAQKHQLRVIEDAAHAIGARYQGKMIGDSQNYVCFSFYPNKNITTGEGGIIVTSNRRPMGRLKILRANGVSREAWKRYHEKQFLPGLVMEPGYKYNLTDLQATLGLEQLKKVEEWLRIRERYAKIYDYYFQKIPGIYLQYRPKGWPGNRHSLHFYTLRLEPKKFIISRDLILAKLNQMNIGAVVQYIPLHLHPFYQKKYHCKKGDFPVAELIADHIFTLPLTPHLKEKEIRGIGQRVSRLLENNRKN